MVERLHQLQHRVEDLRAFVNDVSEHVELEHMLVDWSGLNEKEEKSYHKALDHIAALIKRRQEVTPFVEERLYVTRESREWVMWIIGVAV
jgi:hypothetical protein